MKRIFILVSVLTIFALPVFSQTDTISLQPLEISGSRTPMMITSSVRPLEIINKSQIRTLPATDLPQLLSYSLGFDVRQRGANDMQADISVRGGSFEQTLILLNGISMNDPQTGHHNLDLPVDPAHVDRIELLNGPGARIYGTNAFAGAVNIITDVPSESSLKISLSGGDFSLFSGYISGGFHTGKISHFIGAGAKTCEGYMDNTDFNESRAFYHAMLPLKTGNIQLQAGALNKAFGANSFYSASYPDQFEKIRSEFAAIKGSFGKKILIQPTLYWKRYHDRFELFRDEAPAWYKSHNYHLTDIIGGDLNASITTGLGKTSVGFNLRYEHIYSNVLGELMDGTREAPGETGGFFTREASRNLVSVFLDHQYTRGRFTIGAGALVHYAESFGTGIYPGVDLSLQILKNTKIYTSCNRALRLPTFTDLYYKGPVNIGNPDLVPEESWDFEAGLRYDKQIISGRISGFARMGDHLIDWVKLPGETKWHSDNLTKLTTYGLEAQVKCDLPLLLKNNIFLREVTLSYQWVSMVKPASDFISYYVMDYLKHKLVLNVRHRIWKKIGAAWVLSYRDRAGSYSDVSTGTEKNYESYLLADGKIFWDNGPIGFNVSMSNITNTHYRDISSVMMPGRWFMCGLQLELK